MMFNIQHPDDWCAFEQDYTEMQEVLKQMAEDKSEEWRLGVVEEEAPAFGDGIWLGLENITIKPGKSIAELEKELAEERGIKVRIYVPEWQEESND